MSLKQTLNSIQLVVDNRDDVICVIIDNHSKDDAVHAQLDAIKHPQINVIKNTINRGRHWLLINIF